MRISRLFAAIVAIGAALSAAAEPAVEPDAEPGQVGDQTATGSEVRWEDFDDPSFDATQAAVEDTSAIFSAEDHVVSLGVVAYDSEGRRGRIHTVAAGDTLWDISEAYLGTPWVWPSVWYENEKIANPHLIVPDDRIWISSTEMRRLTKREAEQFLTNPEPSLPASEPEEFAMLTPGAAEDASLSLAALPSGTQTSETGRSLSLPFREDFGFVTDRALNAASSVLGSPSDRVWLAGDDVVYLGLGEGEVEVGQDFTIFRGADAIRDATTDVVVGFHVKVIGWVRVVKVEKESAIAHVMNSNSEFQRGDRVMPRQVRSTSVVIKRTPQPAAGHVVYFPADRSIMGMGDYVYIDRGELHGLEVGSELEVFDSGFNVSDLVRKSVVQIPDEVIATMVVVDLQPTSAVAFVIHSRRELRIGETFRTVPTNGSLASVR